MENFKHIEELIRSKDHHELSEKERAMVDAQIDEETYGELRQGILQLKGERMPMKRNIEKELLQSMKRERSGVAGWLVKPLPAYAFLVILLPFGLIYWLTSPKVIIERQIAEKEVPVMVRDTVIVVKVDTLWRDRIVRVPQPIIVKNDQEKESVPVQNVVESKSLSEQEDLLDLVVRGD